MADLFDEFGIGGQKKGGSQDLLDEFGLSAPSKQNTSLAGDLGTDLKRGVQQLPGIATGLADIPVAALTNKRFVDETADKLGEATGFQPSKWAEEARDEYSPERQAGTAEIEQAWQDGDAVDIAGAYAGNLGNVAGLVAESLPQIVAGGVAGRGALAAGRATGVIGAPTTAAQAARQAAVAGGAGEGAVIAGGTMDQIDDEVDPRRAAAASVGAGVVGGALGTLGARAAQRMGVLDAESAIAGGVGQVAGEAPGLARRVAGGALAEGVFEELPQSVQETMFQNWAEEKDLTEGVARAAVEGTLAGSAIGAGVNALPRKRSEEMGLDPNAGALSAAAVVAVDTEQALLPGPNIAGLLPNPGQTLYGDAGGNLSPDGPVRDFDREYRPTGREQGPRDFGPGIDQAVPRGSQAPLEGQLIRGAGAQQQQAQREPGIYENEPSLGLPAPQRRLADGRPDAGYIETNAAGESRQAKSANVPPKDYVPQGGRGMDQQVPIGKTYSNVLAAKNAIQRSGGASVLEAVQVGPKKFEVRSKQPPKRKPVNRDRDSVLQAAIRLGGIKTEWRQDTTGDSKGNKFVPGVGALWSDKTGTGLDDMASLLDQRGYVPAGEMERDGGVSWLQAALRDEAGGVRKHAAPGSKLQEEISLKAEAQRQADIAAQEEAGGDFDSAASIKSDLLDDSDILEIRATRAAEFAAELDALFEDNSNEPVASTQGRDSNPAATQRAEVEASGSAGAGEQGALRRPDARAEGEDQVAPALELRSQTEQELAQQADAQATARAAEAATVKAEQDKAQADKDRNDFTLTGSDRVSDVAAARGQNDMFAPPTRGQAKAEWVSFPADSGTLNIPRAEMPQIKAEHRGAMVNFLNARGVEHAEETIAADQLKPTQAEYSTKKVEAAKAFEGGDRSILISSDGHVLDGHHQWLAKREAGEDVKVIRLDAPIRELLDTVAEFPSATVDAASASAARGAPKAPAAKIEDAGEQLTYNRKNMFRSGGLKWEDIATENEALKIKLAGKEKVWARPNWEQIIEAQPEGQRDGFRMVAHLVKQAYDGLPKQSTSKTDEGLQRYIAAITEMREAAESLLNDRARVEAVISAVAVKAQRRMSRSFSIADAMASESRGDDMPLFKALFPDQAAGARFERGTPANDKALAISSKAIKAMQWNTDSAVDAMKAIEAGWPAKQEAWQKRGYAVFHNADDEVKARYYESKDAANPQAWASLQLAGRSIEQVAGEFTTRDAAEAAANARIKALDGQYLVLDKRKQLLGSFADESAAIDFARSQTARKQDSEIAEESIDEDWDARAGEQLRPAGRNISEVDFKEAFGFRGVNFGKWVTQDERQRHLNAAYDGFVDLADVMGLPPKAMSLNGMLGVAFGAQGGGKFAAHFVPGVNEINLTKTRGAGALAHEWAHALDHYFGVQAGLARETDPFASMLNQYRRDKEGREIRPEIAQAFKSLVATMKARVESPDETIKRLQESLDNAKTRVNTEAERLRPMLQGNSEALAALDAAVAGDVGEYVALPIPKGKRKSIGSIPQNIKTVFDALGYSSQEAYNQANRLYGVYFANEELKNQVTARAIHTRFYKNSSALDGAKAKPYWSTPWEMFARAFESWVMDALAEKGRFNNYLVRSSKKDQGEDSDAPYPAGAERELFNQAFAKLAADIKHHQPDADGNVALYSRASYRQGQAGQGSRAVPLRMQLKRLTGGWQNAPDIKVVQSVKDLPDRQRRTVERDGAFDIEGILSDGTVYLVADNLRDVKHAAFVMQHEVLGHAGLQGAYGWRLKPLLMSLYNSNADLKRQADALVKQFNYEPAVAMEEVLADMAAADTIKDQAFWSRLVAAMRNAMRSIGMSLTWSEGDIQALLANARRYIKSGTRKGRGRSVYSRNGSSGRMVEMLDDQGRLLAPNGKPSELNQKQWHQARSQNFKRWFGDWQAAGAQERLDAMKPLKLRMPEAWKGLTERERLAKVEESLKGMARASEALPHQDLGEVVMGMSGAKKSVSSAADPAKQAILARLQSAFEYSIYASSSIDQNAPTVTAYHKLLASIDVDGVPLVAVFTVREDANGRMFYNTVAVDRKEEAPAVSPGDMSNETQRSTPANTRAPGDFVRQPLRRVNPGDVSAVTDANGEPQVLYHGTAEQFTVFDQSRAGRSTGHSTAPLGIFLTADGTLAKVYAEKATDGMPGLANVMPLFASIKKPYKMTLAESQALDTNQKAMAMRQKLESEGYDGIQLQGSPVWVAFYNSQVKSATNNTGAFDEVDPDIRYRRSGQGMDDAATAEALRKLGLGGKDADGILEQIRSVTMGGLRAKIAEWATRSEEGLFDGLAGIRRAEEAVGVKDADKQGYVSARMATGIADVMHGVLNYAAPEWRDGVIAGKANTRGVLEILGDLGQDNLTPWLAWLGGKRAQMLKAQGRENNLSDADIAELLAMGKGKEALFDKVYQDYAKINEAVLDLAQEAGLIDQDARAKWATEYYVPFYRVDESDGLFSGPRSKKGLSHQTAAIKALKGGTLPTNDLLTNMLAGWTKRIDAAMKNKALTEVVDNLQGSEYLTDESPRYQQVLISRSQIAEQIRKDRKALAMAAEMLGLPAESNFMKVANQLMKPENEGFEQMWTRVAPTDPDIIRLQRGGKNEYYRVNDESLLRGLKFIEGSVFNDPITRIGRTFKRLLTTGVTASPDFILRNFIRDAAHAWMINKDGFKLGTDSIKGMRDALREDQDYRDLMFAGGSFQGGYVHGTDPEASAQIIRRALEKKGFTREQQSAYLGSLVNTPAKVAGMLGQGWQAYRTLGDKVENANRLSTYKAAIAAGKSPRQAAYEAKDLMDYSLRGNFAAAQWFTDVVPFLNARMQGLYKLGRAVKGDKTLLAKEVAMKGGYIAMFSLLLAGLNDDDERYQALMDWDKDMHWHIFMGDQHFRIPKPFELGLLFGTVPERLLHAMTGTQDGGDLAKAVSQGVFQTLAFNPVPQFYQPIRELQANRNFFRDSPIEDMSDEGKLPEARFDERTSALGRALGQVTGPTLGLSPKQLDHLVQGYTGTLGGYVLAMSSLIAGAFDGVDSPAARAGDLPVLKVLYQGDAVRSTQYQSQFYDMMREADQLHRTVKAYRDEGKVEAAGKLLEGNRDKLKHRGALGMARQQLGAIRKQMDAVYRDTVMDGEAKRKRLDELQMRSNQVAERMVRLAGKDF